MQHIKDPQQLGSLMKDIDEAVSDPDRWLFTPHELLGGREPIDLINSGKEEDEAILRNLVESIKHGLFT